MQAFDIATRDREDAQLDAAFRWVRVEALAASDEAERMEQRAGQHRVGERLRRGSELPPIRVDRLHGAPERGRRVVEFRRDLFQQPDVVQLTERVGGMSRPQDLEVFLEEPRRRAARNLVFVLSDRVEHAVFDRELEAGRQHDGAQHADRILEEPHFRVADAADYALFEIFEPAGVIDDRVRPDVVEQRVDGEVAAEGIFFRGAVGVVALDQVIFGAASSPGGRVAGLELQRFARPDGIGGRRRRQFRLRRQLGGFDLPPECRDLDGLQAKFDVRQAKAAPDDPAVAEELFDLVRMR